MSNMNLFTKGMAYFPAKESQMMIEYKSNMLPLATVTTRPGKYHTIA
jgi:hypothetical protein